MGPSDEKIKSPKLKIQNPVILIWARITIRYTNKPTRDRLQLSFISFANIVADCRGRVLKSHGNVSTALSIDRTHRTLR